MVLIKREKIKFNRKTLYWLKIWLDSQLKFTTHINERLTRAKIVEIEVKQLNNFDRLALGLVRQI